MALFCCVNCLPEGGVEYPNAQGKNPERWDEMQNPSSLRFSSFFSCLN
jgi:hypothetical protein